MPAAALSPLARLARPAAAPRRRGALAVTAAKKADGPVVAIVGVTGAVGQEFLRVSVGGAIMGGETRARSAGRGGRGGRAR